MHAATHDLNQVLHRVRRLAYAEDVADLEYKRFMDLGAFEAAEDRVRNHPNLWIRYSRLSSVRNQQGRLGEAIDFINRAEGEASTLYERACHQANMAYYLTTMGDFDQSIERGLDAVLMDPSVVMGAVNACCAASVLRSRPKLVEIMKLLSERVPTVLSHPLWFERWENDPQLAFGRTHLVPTHH